MNVNININNITIKTKSNITIIQACLNSNIKIDIPRFCFHEKLSIAGNCRMCLVEVVKSPKPVAACAMQVINGMEIYTDTILVKKAREGVLEFLLANHPLDCPICDQGGECDLQDQAMIFGGDIGRFYEYKRAVEDKNWGPLIKTIMTRCIHCTRCVRFLNEVAGLRTLGIVGRGAHMEIGTYLEKYLNTEVIGNIIDLCPVGALTSKPYAFSARSWELISKESIDLLDSLTPDIRIDLRGTEVLRILPRLNEFINDNWISDITRFYYDSINKQRILRPMLKNSDTFLFIPSNWHIILNDLVYFYFINKLILKRKLIFSFSSGNLIDINTLLVFKKFSNLLGSNFFSYNCNLDFKNIDLRNNYLFQYNKYNLLNNDLLILVGINLRLESPLYNLQLRKLYLKKKIIIVSFTPTINLTYYVRQFGIGINNFFKFIEGQHYFSNLFLKFEKPIILFGNFIDNLNNKISFIDLLKNLELILKMKIEYGFILKDIGNIMNNEIGLSYGKNYMKSNSYFLNKKNNLLISKINFKYLINVYDYIRDNLSDFILFQGHHGNNLLKNINILLPGLFYLEKNGKYLSLQGICREIDPLLNFEKDNRNDCEIISMVYLTLNKFYKKSLIKNLNNFYYKVFYKIYSSFWKNKLINYNNNKIIKYYYFIYNLLLNKLYINNNILFNNKLYINIKYFVFFKYYHDNDVLFKKDILVYLYQIFNKKKLNIKIKKININNTLYIRFMKFYNYPFNSFIDSIYKYDTISGSSIILSQVHKQIKIYFTNYNII